MSSNEKMKESDSKPNLDKIPEEIKRDIISRFLQPSENAKNQRISTDFKKFSEDNSVWQSYLKSSEKHPKSTYQKEPWKRLSQYWEPIADLPTVKIYHAYLMQSEPKNPQDLLKLAEIVLESEDLETSKAYAANILRDILTLDAINQEMRAKIALYFGNLILSEDLVLQVSDLPESIDRQAFLQEPPVEQAAVFFREAAILGSSEALRRLGGLTETGDIEPADFYETRENQALHLYRQAIAGGSAAAVQDFIVLMMTYDTPLLRPEDFSGTQKRKQQLVCASAWEQQAAIYQKAIEAGHQGIKENLYRFVMYQCLAPMQKGYIPPWLREILATNPFSLTRELATRLAVNSTTLDNATRVAIYLQLARNIETGVKKVQCDEYDYNDVQKNWLLKADQYRSELLTVARQLDNIESKSKKTPAKMISTLGKFSTGIADSKTTSVPKPVESPKIPTSVAPALSHR
ncbi:MAG TPA: hypothetical protein VHE99_03470 [Gammaproteobacteria bacterium]|nr:hypothetical protein [Gammaproteobacteria bacterium]